MKTIYCENWHRIRKEVRRPMDKAEAFRRFEKSEHFFAVIYVNRSDKPTHFIEFFSQDELSVNFLDDVLDEMATFKYHTIRNNVEFDSTKLFLGRLIVCEKSEDGAQTKGTAFTSSLLIGGKWELQRHVFCEENDFINNESCNFYSEKKVDVSSLYKDIPKFGEWNSLIKNTEMRFLDE